MSASNKKKLRKEQNAASLTKKQQQAQQEAKSLRMYTITFTVAMVLIVAIVIGIALSNPINGIINQKTIAVSINDHDLSIADLSYFYVDTIIEEYNTIYSEYYSLYGQYAYYFIPFSLYEPMDEQEYINEDETTNFKTWADYFVNKAIESAKSVYALYDMAIENGHKLSDTEQVALESYKTTLKSYADQQGYSSSASFLRQTYGNGCNSNNYYDYFKASTYASSYYAAYKEALEFDYDDYRAYETDKYDEYSSFSYAYYLISVSNYKGEGAEDEDGNVTYTDEQLAQALADAKADADALINAAPADNDEFDAAIAALAINAEKTATATKCTAYPYTYVLSAIREWVTSSERTECEMTSIPVESDITDEDGNVTGKEITGYYVVLLTGREDYLENMISVRHILVQFTGGTEDEETGETVYSDDEKKLAMDLAETIYQEWLNGDKTEDSFAELANEKSDDNDGEVTNGGLYENIYRGQMVDAFDAWCFDETRNPGDHEIIETEYGYHIMYFVKTQDLSYRDYLIDLDLIADACEKFLEDAKNSVTYTEGKLSRMEWDIIIYG